VNVAIEPAGHGGAEETDEGKREKVGGAESREQRCMVEEGRDTKCDEDDAEYDAGAKVYFDERADQVKTEEKDQGSCDGSEESAVLAEERADGAGGRAERNENDGKAGDERESRREKAGGGDITFAELLHADAGKHGDVAGDERENAGGEKGNQASEKGPC